MQTKASGLVYLGQDGRGLEVQVSVEDHGLGVWDAEGQEVKSVTLAQLRKAEVSKWGDRVSLRVPGPPAWTLESSDSELGVALARLSEKGRPAGASERTLDRRAVGVLAISLAAFVLLAWFVAVPWLGDRVGEHIPREWESPLTLGVQQTLAAQMPLQEEPTQQLQEFARLLKLDSDILLEVRAAEAVNAFAMVGNRIVVLEPAWKALRRGDELAALLLHEQAHLRLRHTSRATFRTLASYVLLSWILGDTSGLVAAVLQNLDSLQRLSYSREFESQADAQAVEGLVARGLGVQAFENMLRRLEAASSQVSLVPEILSTHPVTQARIEAAVAVVRRARLEPLAAIAVDRQALDEVLLP